VGAWRGGTPGKREVTPMSHDPHHVQPGYSPDQVLYDGCTECDMRSGSADHGLDHLDVSTFERAWERAADWQRKGLPDMAHNERPLFAMLVAVMIQFERRGIPFGYLPRNVMPPSPVAEAAPGLLDAYAECEGYE
jgi:hypothetical protein